jgi:hypothetical protein
MKTNSLWRELLLVGVVAIGAAGVWTIVGSYITLLLPRAEPSLGFGENVLFLADGTPLIQQRLDVAAEATYCDLQRNPVLPDFENGQIIQAYLPETWTSTGMSSLQRIADGLNPQTFWYVLQDDHGSDASGYLAGYDSLSKRCIGYLGRNGFQERKPVSDEQFNGVHPAPHEQGLSYITGAPIGRSSPYAGVPFAQAAFQSIFVPTRDGKLYLADLHKRTVSLVYDAEAIRSAAGLNVPLPGSTRTKWEIALRTDQSVILLDGQGARVGQFSIPDAVRSDAFHFGITNSSEAVIESVQPSGSLSNSTTARLFHIHADKKVSETNLTLVNPAAGRHYQVYGGIETPSPVALAAIVALDRGGEISRLHLEPTLRAAVSRIVGEYRPTFLIAMGISFVLAIACYVRLARYRSSRRERVIWPVFVLLFGLPAWIGFRFGLSWPILEPCPNCDAKTPRNASGCRVCDVEFPTPAQVGTEVFA